MERADTYIDTHEKNCHMIRYMKEAAQFPKSRIYHLPGRLPSDAPQMQSEANIRSASEK